MFWYDGNLFHSDEISLNINHPALLYGASAFTTMRVYNRNLDHPLVYWSEHCDRLLTTLRSFGWTLPQWAQIRSGAAILSASFPVLRITVFPDGKEWITGRDLPQNLNLHQREGVKGWVTAHPLHQRSSPQYKTGNYLAPWLAYQQAQNLEARDAILCDQSGNWLETSTGNLWGWQQGKWYTPGFNDSLLPGISRAHWLKIMESASIPVYETLWTPKLVEGMEAIAYSNCVVELIPFREIWHCDRSFRLEPSHPAVKNLQTLSEVIN
ncbi:MAG: hypothetical protein N5P05_000001 [Chroococcopsis gigantea SAG 12.99]|jgi:4-amino-4-deoxychorismate lyase|nr:hypothetical protein [Chroococcopsis gigantea SAG 12.99]